MNHRKVPHILIVDDTPSNLQLLTSMLKEHGYKPRPVISGAVALESAAKMPPDLILLDINMPKMNGFEVCGALKRDALLKDIPVIFLSAQHETEDKVRAFQAGGVDYITKPFQFEEVRARVECQLNMRRLQKNLEVQNSELVETNRRLREAEALRDSLVHMVIHDMRSPLTVQIGYLECLLEDAFPPLGGEERGWVNGVYETSIKLSNMVNSLLDINRMEAGSMPIHHEKNDLLKIAKAAADFYQPVAAGRRISVEPAIPMMAYCDAILTQRVIENIVGNALKYTVESGSISVLITQRKEDLRIAITDDGAGIAPEYHNRIFMKFGQADGQQKKHSSGLGLAFCKLAIDAQGGQIGVESEVGKGSTFWFTLPLAP